VRLVLPVFAVLVACTVEEDEFANSYAKAVCNRLEECQRSDYEQAYEDRDACVEDWAEIADTILDVGDTLGQEYSPQSAQDCLESIREASCGEFSDGQVECEVFE
jgi:hypothetical protein